MTGSTAIGAIALTTLFALAPLAAKAGSDNIVPPPGSMMWNYECKPGVECPTRCAAKGTELFSTGSYLTLTILQLPNQAFWFQIDTGQTFVYYLVAQSDPVVCSVSGATLVSARAADSTKPAPAPRP